MNAVTLVIREEAGILYQIPDRWIGTGGGIKRATNGIFNLEIIFKRY